MSLKLGFLMSGRGSNVEAILKNIKNGYLDADPQIIITNKKDSKAKQISEEYGVMYGLLDKSSLDVDSLDESLINILKARDVDVVCLAGFFKKIVPIVIDKYQNRILNIYPSLLPKYGGKGMYGSNIHKAVINSDDKISGVTVHLINENYDQGKILSQITVPRYDKDNAQTLSDRVLRVEHVIYSQVLKDISLGLIDLDA